MKCHNICTTSATVFETKKNLCICGTGYHYHPVTKARSLSCESNGDRKERSASVGQKGHTAKYGQLQNTSTNSSHPSSHTPLLMWCSCYFYQEGKSVSPTSQIWAGLVTYFDQWDVGEVTGWCAEPPGSISSFHFHSLGIQLPSKKIPDSLQESPRGGEVRHPGQHPQATVIWDLPVPSWPATWQTQDTWVSPANTTGRPRIMRRCVVVILNHWVLGWFVMQR